MTRAHEYVEWAREKWAGICPLIRPVQIRFGYPSSSPKVFAGIFYGYERTYEAHERAVEHGRVRAGEKFMEYRFSLLGKMPPRLERSPKVISVWENRYPVDFRVCESVGDWYLGGWYQDYYTRSVANTSPFAAFHFDNHFDLHEWCPAVYGPYEGRRIDHQEENRYKRYPMGVEFLDE